MLMVVKMMNIDKKQFDVLKLLENQKAQRKIAEETKYSLGTVNKILKELSILNLITDSVMNENGRKILEQYRVRRAVFLAAGFGERLVPITLNTPKPLIRVNGKRIIDGLIDACLAVGIEEIYIVRGYLAEEFDQLLYKYPINDIMSPARNHIY
jgi:DNA-binding Lrp family transcriptional regulator